MDAFNIPAQLDELCAKGLACVRTMGPQMVQKCKLDSELSKFTTSFPNVKTHLELTYTQFGSVLQQWNCAWNPKCDWAVSPHFIPVRKMKADCEFCPGEYEQNCFAAQFYKPGTDPFDYGIMQWKINQFLEQAELDYAHRSFIWGKHDPTNATPGAYNVMDGLFEVTNKAIDAGEASVVPTGEITEENVWEVIKMMRDCSWVGKKYKMNQLLVSCKVLTMLLDYLESCGKISGAINMLDRTMKPNPSQAVWIPGSNIQICPLVSFGDSDAMIMTPKENILNLFDLQSDMQNLFVQQDKRKICIGHDRKGGMGYLCPGKKFICVNNMIPSSDTLGDAAPENYYIPANDLLPGA